MERALPDRKFPTEIVGNFSQMENAQALPCYTTLARQRFKRRAYAVPNKIHKL